MSSTGNRVELSNVISCKEKQTKNITLINVEVNDLRSGLKQTYPDFYNNRN